eukprot:scaffold4274_cov175-Amphora_coffeaeformis.AAC.1
MSAKQMEKRVQRIGWEILSSLGPRCLLRWSRIQAISRIMTYDPTTERKAGILGAKATKMALPMPSSTTSATV